MDADCASDVRRLENGHGLDHQRRRDSGGLAQLPHAWSVCDFFEERVVLVESMSNLVDGLFFWH